MAQPTHQKKSKSWLSLSEAAELIGVHFTTLRRWADAGNIECMRTPGGRRRFKTEVVAQFIKRHHGSSMVNSPALVENRLIDHTRRDLRASNFASKPWMYKFDQAQKHHLRQTGSRLVALLLQYACRNENGDIYLEEGKRLSAGYGTLSYQAGLPLVYTIQAFLFFRRSILDAVHETGFMGEVSDETGHQLYKRASYFFDEILLALVGQYNFLSTSNPLAVSD